MSPDDHATTQNGAVGPLAQARAGDADSFMRAVHPFLRSIHCVCFGVLQSRADAEEVAQETLLKAWTHIGDLREDNTLRAWLLRIAMTESLLRRKRNHIHRYEGVHRKGEPDLEEEMPVDFVDDRSTPDRDLESHQTRRAIAAAVRNLPFIYRQVFLLRDIQQLSVAETAAILEISIEAVMTRSHRARLQMRDQLAPFFNKPGSFWLPVAMMADMGKCFVHRAVSCKFVTQALSPRRCCAPSAASRACRARVGPRRRSARSRA